MTAVPGAGASQQAAVEAALLVLERMGLSPADLTAVPAGQVQVPTFAGYVPVVAGAVSAGTRRAYGSYWNRVVEQWGERRLDEVTPSEIRQLMRYTREHVVPRRNARGGRSAQEHLVAALRCLYRRAVDDGLITEASNPARKVDKPRRLPSTRRAVPGWRRSTRQPPPQAMTRTWTRCCCTPRPHAGAAARLACGRLTLTRSSAWCCCGRRARRSAGSQSPTLMARLSQHAEERHAPRDGQLLRYTDGRPITYRRYDHLWTRIGGQLPWVATQQVSTHWIRHTTLTWVERNFGYATARAYAGHNGTGGEAGVTSTYVRASVHEVAAALAALTGEPHPLAVPEEGDLDG
ncbi:MAG TPA: hypothetical protein VMU94_23440 [Streptosporangiaceae bacterium]|nr:hypothetical protein [Streptosporangiaceae bacterium]